MGSWLFGLLRPLKLSFIRVISTQSAAGMWAFLCAAHRSIHSAQLAVRESGLASTSAAAALGKSATVQVASVSKAS